MTSHSTFSTNRHGRFRICDLLRRLFERKVEGDLAEGSVGGEGCAVDASLIRVDVNRQTGGEALPPDANNHVVRAYLTSLDIGQRR